MIIILKENVTDIEAQRLMERLQRMNLQVMLHQEKNRYHLAVVSGESEGTVYHEFARLPLVEKVLPFTQKFKLTSREFKKTPTIIEIKDKKIGDGHCIVMAGPCSIESAQQIHEIARCVAQSGASVLRGGAFKPRTSPYEFQGLGEDGLRFMQEAARQNNMLCVSEVMDVRDLELVARYVDIVQIGARNMQNFSMLKELGKINKPILLKRGLSATYTEFLMAAEYILSHGNPNVMLCERGIRTFETYTRNTLDIAAVPVLKDLSHLPVIIDPSHGTGLRHLVPSMAYAAVAAGTDGLIVEVHTHPDQSISDAKQTISPAQFDKMMTVINRISEAVS